MMADLIEIPIVVKDKGLKQSITTVSQLEKRIAAAAKAVDAGAMSQDQFNKVLLQAKRDYQGLGLSSQKATYEVRKYAQAQKEAAAAARINQTAMRTLTGSKTRFAAAASSASDATNRVRQSFLNTANSIAILDGPLGGIASRFSAFGVLVGRTGIALAGFAVAMTGTGLLLNRAARAGMELETTMLSLEGAVALTGGAAGKTAGEIEQLVRSIEASTLANRGPLRTAAMQMLSFQTIFGETFDRALMLSQDFAQVFGKDVSAAALQVAKALENPRQSLASLERAYGALAPGVREHVIELQKQGKLYEAQEIILRGYEERIGGIAKQAAKGLAGAFDSLTAAIADFFEKLSKVVNTGSVLVSVVNFIASAINKLTDNLERIVATVQAAVVAFGVKLVASFVLAGGAVKALTLGVNLLRIALLRLPFVAIILAAGELIYQFTRLSRATGGFGEAMSMLKDVGVEVFTRIKDAFGLVPAAVKVGASEMKVFFLSAIEDMLRAFQDMTWNIAGGLNSIFGTNLEGARFEALSGRIGQSPIERAIQSAELAAAGARREMGDLLDSVTAPLQSVIALRDAIKEVEDEVNGTSGPRPPAPPPIGEDGKALVSMAQLIEARLIEIAQEKELLGLYGRQRREREILFQLQKQNKDADIKLTEAQLVAAAKLIEQEENYNNLIRERRELQENLAKTIENSMEKAFMSMVDGTKSVQDAFKDMARQIIADLYRVIVVQRIVGNVGGGGLAGGLGRILGISNMASGGTMRANQPYLVGERGPELVVPGRNATIFNADLTKKASGSSGDITVNNNINVSGGSDPAAIRMEVAKLMPQITEATKTAVIDARRRGGQMRAAFS
jgi:hypothetical protein